MTAKSSRTTCGSAVCSHARSRGLLPEPRSRISCTRFVTDAVIGQSEQSRPRALRVLAFQRLQDDDGGLFDGAAGHVDDGPAGMGAEDLACEVELLFDLLAEA